ncbi:acetylornithine deacetylase [Oleiphilus messinensis]|uniref:Acetylornithine deacetylase n=1 Tax=Oleiphilus messinensis TaxID=141451 RepID=A0A1Y0IDE7_9GAMM|nr:acetylornithine deacetylase [Oleiphilus messinensis]ARU58558.1 acetylornithine deacetylase [Oleiphilus messinensis]
MQKIPNLPTMLSELIARPSVSCSSPQWDQSNESVILLLAEWLERLGFRVAVTAVPGFPGKFNLQADIGPVNDNSVRRGLVLSGHSDTVPCDTSLWQTDPFKMVERDGRYYGLGSCDMKGFFPIVLSALERVELGNLQHPLTVLATADEESSMCGARSFKHQDFPFARAAIIGEPTNLQPIRMHKGIMMEAIRLVGQSGHSSNPELGNNALDCMHSVLGALLTYRREMQAKYRDSGFEVSVPTLNLGHIHGGDNPNRICGACELQFDLRPLPGMKLDDLRQEIHDLVQPIAERDGIRFTMDSLFPGVDAFETRADAEIVQLCEQYTARAAGSVAFATEGPFLQAMGLETVILGAGSIDQAHQPNEYLSLDQLNPAISTIEKLIHHYCF